MKEDNNKYSTIMNIIFGAILLFVLYKTFEDNYYLRYDDLDYTIAKTIRYSGRGGTERNINYLYFVDNKKYERANKRDYDYKDPLNKYYVVKYSKKKPNVSEIDLSQEVTDTLKIREAGFINFGK